MTDTEIVPRERDREPADRPPLVDAVLADELLARAQSEGVELLGPDGLLSQVTKAVLERALGEEMPEHLGYDKRDPAGRGSGNSRNGRDGQAAGHRDRWHRSGRAARPQRVVQPADRAQGPDSPGRVQRPHHCLACARTDDPRHPRAPARDV
jgi:hypothetical protein